MRGCGRVGDGGREGDFDKSLSQDASSELCQKGSRKARESSGNQRGSLIDCTTLP